MVMYCSVVELKFQQNLHGFDGFQTSIQSLKNRIIN